jgi:ABC-type transporter Mla maintaining outer membrane lipid asymmetry ATPase subunit MlaF
VTPAPVIQITGVRKSYSGLRPFRMQSLVVAPGERVAIGGLDAGAAELMVNLVTGASVPDEGQVQVFGRKTTDVADGDAWLASLDQFGIVSERAVMLEGATLAQNLALPFSLEIDPMPADLRVQVARIADECGIPPGCLEQVAGDAPPAVRARAHLARALALGPELLLMEHPTAALPEGDRAAFGADVARVCEGRALTTLVLTLDRPFATIVAHRALEWQPSTGALVPRKRRWLW